jgi:pilus assembly protein CpaC
VRSTCKQLGPSATVFGAATFLWLCLSGAAPQAQQPTVEAVQTIGAVPLIAGKSFVLTTDFDVNRIAITNPAIADATVVQPREVLLDGKSAGTTTLIVWGPSGRLQYDLVVSPAVTTLQQDLERLFPGEQIRVSSSEDAVILSGRVSNNATMLRVGEIAAASSPKARVVNMLQLPTSGLSEQVLLQVRFAEVNRRAISELGVNLFTSAIGFHDVVGRATTQQFSAPDFSELATTKAGGELVSSQGELTFSDFLNVFLLSNRYDFGVLVRALKSSGFFQSLAEPNLIAYNGQEASFLAGGEIPVPIVSGTSGSVGIQWKEYGIRLSFRPTIAGDTIRLRVRPEVSTLDFPNGVTIGGFRVPALSTRRAETDVELRDGQTFAIAGLMDNISQDTQLKIPGLGDIPILGIFFKSRATRSERTELMVLVTPRLVRALNPDEVPPLPTVPEGFLPPEQRGTTVDAPTPSQQPSPAERR